MSNVQKQRLCDIGGNITRMKNCVRRLNLPRWRVRLLKDTHDNDIDITYEKNVGLDFDLLLLLDGRFNFAFNRISWQRKKRRSVRIGFDLYPVFGLLSHSDEGM